MTSGEWQDESLVELVRQHLSSPTFEYAGRVREVAVVDGDLRIVLDRIGSDDRPHAVRYSLERLPLGPWTGCDCDTPEEWAAEVRGDLMEVLDTREIESGARRVEADGVIGVRWWRGDSWSR